MDTFDDFREQLANHYLELLSSDHELTACYLRARPDSRIMSTLFIFSPEGIVITGDCHPGRGGRRGGVIAQGYGLDWFAQPLEPRYLASKFLTETWVKSAFKRRIGEYISEAFQDRSLRVKRCAWRVGGKGLHCTEGRALRYLIEHDELIETAESAYNNLPAYYESGRGWLCPYDSDFLSAGYDYDEIELGWLVALHERFVALYNGRVTGAALDSATASAALDSNDDMRLLEKCKRLTALSSKGD